MCRPLFPNYTGKCVTNPGGKCFVREDPNNGKIYQNLNQERNFITLEDLLAESKHSTTWENCKHLSQSLDLDLEINLTFLLGFSFCLK